MSSVEGLDSLLSTLAELGGNVKSSAKKGVHRAAKRIQKNAKLLCPVDTGQLRNSIKTNAEETEEGAEAKVYTNCEHAAYVEFGTGPNGNGTYPYKIDGVSLKYKGDRWKTPHGYSSGQRAQPYLGPAFMYAKNSEEVIKDVADSLEADIKKLESGK